MPKTSKKHGREVGGRKTCSLKPVAPSWPIQTAKARFSEVFRRARTEGPQLITRQGKEGVVMISANQYD
jgi:antitoxin Phd